MQIPVVVADGKAVIVVAYCAGDEQIVKDRLFFVQAIARPG